MGHAGVVAPVAGAVGVASADYRVLDAVGVDVGGAAEKPRLSSGPAPQIVTFCSPAARSMSPRGAGEPKIK